MDLVLELGSKELNDLREAFVASGDGLSMAQFVGTVLELLPREMVFDEDGKVAAAAKLCELFSMVDLDGNGSMDWDEFSYFIIENVESGDSRKGRLKSTWKEIPGLTTNTMHRTTVTGVRFIRELQKMVAFEEGQAGCKIYECAVQDPGHGFPLIKQLSTNQPRLRGGDMVDVAYLPEQALLCFCVEDFSMQLYDARMLRPQQRRFQGMKAMDFERLDLTVREAGSSTRDDGTGAGGAAHGLQSSTPLVHEAEAELLHSVAKEARADEAEMRRASLATSLSVESAEPVRSEVEVPLVKRVHCAVLQRQVVFVEASQLLLTAGTTSDITIWDVSASRGIDGRHRVRVHQRGALTGHTHGIIKLVMCGPPVSVSAMESSKGPDSREGYVASIDGAKRLKVWKYRGKRVIPIATKKQLGFGVAACAFVTEAKVLLVGGRSHIVEGYDVTSDGVMRIQQLPDHEGGTVAIAEVPERSEAVTLDGRGNMHWWNVSRALTTDDRRHLEMVNINIPAGHFLGRDLTVIPSLPQMASDVMGSLWEGLPFLRGGMALRIGGIAAGAELARQIAIIQRRARGEETTVDEAMEFLRGKEEGDDDGGKVRERHRRGSLAERRKERDALLAVVRRSSQHPRGVAVAIGDRFRGFESVPATDEIARAVSVSYDADAETLEVVLERDTSTVELPEGRVSRVREEVTGEIHTAAVLHSKFRKLLIGTDLGQVGIYNRGTGAGIIVLQPHSSEVVSICQVEHDGLIISASTDGSVAVVDEMMDTGTLERAQTETIRRMAAKAESKLVRKAIREAKASQHTGGRPLPGSTSTPTASTVDLKRLSTTVFDDSNTDTSNSDANLSDDDQLETSRLHSAYERRSKRLQGSKSTPKKKAKDSKEDMTLAERMQAALPPGAVRFLSKAHGSRVGISSMDMAYELSLLVTGGTDGSVRVWDFQSFALESELHGHSCEVVATRVVDPLPCAITSDAEGNVCLFETSRSNAGGRQHILPLVAWKMPISITRTSDVTRAAISARRSKRVEDVHTGLPERGHSHRRGSVTRRPITAPPQGSDQSDAVVVSMLPIAVDLTGKRVVAPKRDVPMDRVLLAEGLDDGRLIIHDLSGPLLRLKVKDRPLTTPHHEDQDGNPVSVASPRAVSPSRIAQELCFAPVPFELTPVSKASYDARAARSVKGPSAAHERAHVDHRKHGSAHLHVRSKGPSRRQVSTALETAIKRASRPHPRDKAFEHRSRSLFNTDLAVPVVAAELAHVGYAVRDMTLLGKHSLLATIGSLSQVRVWDLKPFIGATRRAPADTLTAICVLDYGDSPLLARPLARSWVFPVPPDYIRHSREARARHLLQEFGLIDDAGNSTSLSTHLHSSNKEPEELTDEDEVALTHEAILQHLSSSNSIRRARRARTRQRLLGVVQASSMIDRKKQLKTLASEEAFSTSAASRRGDVLERLSETTTMPSTTPAPSKPKRSVTFGDISVQDSPKPAPERSNTMRNIEEEDDEEEDVHGIVDDQGLDQDLKFDAQSPEFRRADIVFKLLQRPWTEDDAEEDVRTNSKQDLSPKPRPDDVESITWHNLESISKLESELERGGQEPEGADPIALLRQIQTEQNQESRAARLYPALIAEEARHSLEQKEKRVASKLLRLSAKTNRFRREKSMASSALSLNSSAPKLVIDDSELDSDAAERSMWAQATEPSEWLRKHMSELPKKDKWGSKSPARLPTPLNTTTNTSSTLQNPDSTTNRRFHSLLLPPRTPMRGFNRPSMLEESTTLAGLSEEFASSVAGHVSYDALPDTSEAAIEEIRQETSKEIDSISRDGLAKLRTRLKRRGLRLHGPDMLHSEAAKKGSQHVSLSVDDLKDHASKAVLTEDVRMTVAIEERKQRRQAQQKRKQDGEKSPKELKRRAKKVAVALQTGTMMTRGGLGSLAKRTVARDATSTDKTSSSSRTLDSRRRSGHDQLESLISSANKSLGSHKSGAQLARRRRFGPYSKKEVSTFRALFQRTDRDGSGDVSREEFLADPLITGGDHMATHLEAMFDSVDKDGSGTISLVEFARVFFPDASASVFHDIITYVRWRPEVATLRRRVRRRYAPHSIRKMRILFQSYDTDRSGLVSKTELIEGMERVKNAFSAAEIRRMEARSLFLPPAAKYRAVGASHDPVLPGGNPESSIEAANTLELLGLLEHDIDELMQSVDADGNEELDFDEFVTLFGPTFEPDAPLEVIDPDEE